MYRFDFRFIVCISLDIPSRHHSSIADYKYDPSNAELLVETRSSAGGGSSSSLSTSSLASARRVFNIDRIDIDDIATTGLRNIEEEEALSGLS